MSKTLDSRLLALEATQPGNPYGTPLMPGCKRLPILALDQAGLDHARARGFVAELDTPENNERFLG
jgi:hypothetical protein